MNCSIRKERPEDIQAIHELTKAAFQEAPHADHSEQFIVDTLRQSGALSISLVAEEHDVIIGHVALSPIQISDGTEGWYGLGPISVAPSSQGKGIGSQLMHAAIEELKRIKANGCVLLGDPDFYHRFGFKPEPGLILPDVPPEYFQALLLHGDLPQGVVSYHESFETV